MKSKPPINFPFPAFKLATFITLFLLTHLLGLCCFSNLNFLIDHLSARCTYSYLFSTLIKLPVSYIEPVAVTHFELNKSLCKINSL